MKRLTRLLLLLACAGGILLSGPYATAEGHYRVNKHRWWFRGADAFNADGSGRGDAINIFYYRGGRITLDRITKHIADHAGLERKEECNHRAFGVCVDHKICDGDDQYLTFVHYKRDRKPGGDAKSVDREDRTRETGCGSRFHTRIWDDQQHDRNTIHHRVKDWAPANIHFDHDIKGKGDTVTGPFERHESWLLRKMRTHCEIPHWRVLPGSASHHKKPNEAKFSDGFVSLISLAHKSAGRCPARP